jgi:hypothetical protein
MSQGISQRQGMKGMLTQGGTGSGRRIRFREVSVVAQAGLTGAVEAVPWALYVGQRRACGEKVLGLIGGALFAPWAVTHWRGEEWGNITELLANAGLQKKKEGKLLQV